ncbi:benzoyl-CoA reductase [Rhodococcus oxybenzonivorans]|uniref:Benzoyl-CoA reductase n=1 Tax=Rhodococcus oxybenzonivorans TaxID=1990687 RepID=A0A2S2C1Z9_9NOCA|nr:acyl-CoA dehydratase activase [Rhodococcus oxybenzonivorans]AWK74879.1 benzoyl-CoA reductase [Rhodococcus oxybenzonivorans]
MGWYVMGVDLGSTTAKAVIVDQDGGLAGSSVVQMGAVSRDAVLRAMDHALTSARIGRDSIRRTISTGYGRKLVPGADRSFTEITCHARGAAALYPGVRLVIDIGGQDSKVIAVDSDGLVDRFAMNDRCASGTGRFFDVLARALEVDVNNVGDLALSGAEGLEVSSMCATFAETEVISMLAQGREKSDIAASVHKAVAARTLGLVAQVGKATPTVMTGGVAQNAAARHYIEKALRHPIDVLAQPQIAGAYGAGLLARDEYAGSVSSAESRDAKAKEQLSVRAAGIVPQCAGCDGTAGDHNHVSVPLTLRRKS